jgi:hypothetical protein
MAGQKVRLIVGGLLFGALSCLLGCATSFVGDAQFPGGAPGCFKQCQAGGMEMASFVYVGEYSSACACKLKANAPAQTSSSNADVDGAVVAAGAGVEMQRRRAEAAQHGALMSQH